MSDDEKHKAAREKAETMRKSGATPRETRDQLDKDRRRDMVKPVPKDKK